MHTDQTEGSIFKSILFFAPMFDSIIGVYLTYPTSFVVGMVLMAIYTIKGKWLEPKYN